MSHAVSCYMLFLALYMQRLCAILYNVLLQTLVRTSPETSPGSGLQQCVEKSCSQTNVPYLTLYIKEEMLSHCFPAKSVCQWERGDCYLSVMNGFNHYRDKNGKHKMDPLADFSIPCVKTDELRKKMVCVLLCVFKDCIMVLNYYNEQASFLGGQ